VEDFLIGFLGRIGESGEGGKRARSERVRPKRGNQREENEGSFCQTRDDNSGMAI
jgi:hypothetical protein